MTQKPLPVKEINPYQSHAVKHANRKMMMIILVVIAVIALGAVAIYFGVPHNKFIKEKADGTKEVDVSSITDNNAFVDYQGQQYRDEKTGAITVFDYDGFYKGNGFREYYADDSNKVIMRISQEMKPNDGIIEGFVVEKIEDQKATIYIFLDEDWKKLIGKTNIFWGASYGREKEFNFTNQVSEGVYMDSVPDEISRLGKDFKVHIGGIIVGDLTRDDDVDKTLIRFI